jgi:mycothiol synthase
LEGLSWRALTERDLPAVFELEAAGEAFADGVVEVALSDIEAGWSRPDFDPEVMSLGAFLDSRLIAYALVFLGRVDARVHPDYRGLGLGTTLAKWTWEAARAEGRDRVGQTVSDNEQAAAAMFRALGYTPSYTAWILRTDLSNPRSAPTLPNGYLFRPYRPGEDDAEMYQLLDEAFDEWRGADSESMGLDNWVASTLHCAVPDWVVLISHGADLVGMAVGLDYGPGDEGWVEQVAVHRDHRRRGLGKALMEESFRRFQEAGLTRAGVSTDSRSGALGLYEAVGMSTSRSYTRWAKTGL